LRRGVGSGWFAGISASSGVCTGVSDGAMARVEVITGPERRRRWNDEQKRAIVAASLEPGAVVADVARRAEVGADQIYRWRQQFARSDRFAQVLIAPPEAARVGTITADNGLCLDLNGGVPVDDNHVQVYACNDTPAQRWTLAPDGTLQVVGKCAEVTDENTVHIAGCDSGDDAQWRAGPDDTLVNVATDACLTGADKPSTAVTVKECTAGDGQEWTIPD